MHLYYNQVFIRFDLTSRSAIRAHDMKQQPHFFTLHSWIGILAIALFYGQVRVVTANILGCIKDFKIIPGIIITNKK